MKPSWSDAPEWAKYLAMDEDGEWFWYEDEPSQTCSYWSAGGMVDVAACPSNRCWRDTLEPRPLDTST